MFTGIVQCTATLARSEPRGGDLRLVFAAPRLDLSDVAPGDSIAVSGCCLTVVAIDGDELAFDASNETLSLTTLGALNVGDAVNLEMALQLSDRLGGHLVSGHVDGLARIVSIIPDARSQRWEMEVPDRLSRYIAAKGSVCLDGVSLTVNQVDGARFSVNLIPHTVEVTAFKDRKPDDALNLEVDMMARYLERLAHSR